MSILFHCILNIFTHFFHVLTSRVCSGDELEKIKALFNEKEKELSLAVAKVEDLTRQLDDLRTGRNGDVSTINTTTSVELEKLRNEIAVSERVDISLFENANSVAVTS